MHPGHLIHVFSDICRLPHVRLPQSVISVTSRMHSRTHVALPVCVCVCAYSNLCLHSLLACVLFLTRDLSKGGKIPIVGGAPQKNYSKHVLLHICRLPHVCSLYLYFHSLMPSDGSSGMDSGVTPMLYRLPDGSLLREQPHLGFKLSLFPS